MKAEIKKLSSENFGETTLINVVADPITAAKILEYIAKTKTILEQENG